MISADVLLSCLLRWRFGLNAKCSSLPLPRNFVTVADKGLAVCVPWVMAWAVECRAEARRYVYLVRLHSVVLGSRREFASEENTAFGIAIRR